jgi:hypothetical protein
VKDFVKEKHFANQNIEKKTRKKAKKKGGRKKPNYAGHQTVFIGKNQKLA